MGRGVGTLTTTRKTSACPLVKSCGSIWILRPAAPQTAWAAGPGSTAYRRLTPYQDGPGGSCDEIWALGLRNPWRFSFDRLTGDLFIGDVGENLQEEIDLQPASSPGGENYGWHCYEGSLPFLPAACDPPSAYVFPIHAYSHTVGSSVIGGFVYRGSAHAEMAGHYFFADYGTPPTYSSARLWSLAFSGGGWQAQEHGLYNANFSSFGEDGAGELYLADVTNGMIFKLFHAEHQAFLPLAIQNP